MLYITKDGKEIECNMISESQCNKLIDNNLTFKVNLPPSEKKFETGNGEGVWACCDDKTYESINNDVDGLYVVTILNDSYYYNGLNYGDIVLVEVRPGYRPVAIYEELYSKFGKSNWE